MKDIVTLDNGVELRIRDNILITYIDLNDQKHVEIPDGVRVISTAALRDCGILESVHIPNSVTTIRESAFSNCSGLKKVTIPQSVTSMGSMAFSECDRLEIVRFSPESKLEEIPDNAFSSCHALHSIIIPDAVTKIGDRAFYGCGALESIHLPKKLKSIGKQAFSCSRCLISTTSTQDANETPVFTFPSNLKEIGEDAFLECEALQSVIMTGDVNVGKFAFASCGNLSLTNSEKSIFGVGAFSTCESVNITISANTPFSKKAFSLEEAYDTDPPLGTGITRLPLIFLNNPNALANKFERRYARFIYLCFEKWHKTGISMPYELIRNKILFYLYCQVTPKVSIQITDQNEQGDRYMNYTKDEQEPKRLLVDEFSKRMKIPSQLSNFQTLQQAWLKKNKDFECPPEDEWDTLINKGENPPIANLHPKQDYRLFGTR